jgi:dihydroflavonol-4-reductase
LRQRFTSCGRIVGMRVLVTGGTGFLGSHATAGLVRTAHDVRLLVRRPQQVAASLSPLGVDATDVVEGDVLDEPAVARALDGCDAVVHAAAIFSVDPRRADAMRRTNVRATEIVLGQAAERGLDPVVYVSSAVALTRNGGSGPDLPLSDLDLPYTRSKTDAERFARRLQDDGVPVVSVYPGAVHGPHDPYVSDNNNRLRWLARRLFPIWSAGGLHMVDVRDTAAVIAAVVEPGRGPRRYVVPGHHVRAKQLYGTLREVMGRRYPYVALPAAVSGPATRLIDVVQRRLPERWHYPADHEGAQLILRDTRLDDHDTRRDLAIEPRPFGQTLADTIHWMAESGHLPARYAALVAAQD